jgi:predicted DNA-binding antitoxin AbrB/MazE fold protein
MMVRDVDAIFTQGAFQPVEPLVLPEGTRVRLRVEDQPVPQSKERPAKIHSPKLAQPEQAADFVLEVREINDAGV